MNLSQRGWTIRLEYEILDPVSRVTGIPGWYWILGIKCSDTTGVGLIVRSSLAKGIHLFQNIGMLCVQEFLFCRVGGLLETL